jgi:hypothetical protein
MSLALIGGLVGLAFGVVEYLMFGALIACAAAREGRGRARLTSRERRN